MKANTRFLLVTQRYTVLELSLFILSDTVGPTVIAETKLRARLDAAPHQEKPGSELRVPAPNRLHSRVFQFFFFSAFCK